jgi:dCTP deaminase
MTILSGQTIRRLGILRPFAERASNGGVTYGLGPSGYDLRIDLGEGFEDDDAECVIGPGRFQLAATLEHFTMPDDVVGVVHDKSTWARRGLCVQNTVIEPGWRGYLTIELTNHGLEHIVLRQGIAIAQVVFHRLDEPAEQPYGGKYQDQEQGPQAARS